MLKKFIDKWKHRLRSNSPAVLYSKFFVIPSVYQFKPIQVNKESEREIHALVSAKDFDMLMWSVSSFYAQTGVRYALVIHDDGTVKPRQAKSLGRLFPGSRFITRTESDAELGRALANYPRCHHLRNRTPLAMKVFDFFHYARGDSLLLLDSDVLFFRNPVELTQVGSGVKENIFNADAWSSYVLPLPELCKLLNMAFPARVNIGLGVVWKDIYSPDKVEEALGHEAVNSAPYLVAQTLVTLMATALPVRLLGPEYAVTLKPGIEGYVSKHYTRVVRHLFYREGVPRVRAIISAMSDNYN